MIPANKQSRANFSVNSVSISNPYGVKYYVAIAEYNEKDISPTILKRYISYMLQYRRIAEVDTEEEAEYIVYVKYIGFSSNPDRQILEINAFSRRVLDAIGEQATPSWKATTIHNGRLRNKDKLLAMMSFSIRGILGGNINPYEKNQFISPNSEQVMEIYSIVEPKT
ncbi:hypothetical protein SAMN02745866_03186 [Alteromonadaceae bacterium Bs31]|nr:hypothetical protein SAMN02745866_03186 [Alteromonadaceae bacterium Bs31]